MKTIPTCMLVLMIATSCSGYSGHQPLTIDLYVSDQIRPELRVNNRDVNIGQLEDILQRLIPLDPNTAVILTVAPEVDATTFISIVSILHDNGVKDITVIPLDVESPWRISTSGVYRVYYPLEAIDFEPRHAPRREEIATLSLEGDTISIQARDIERQYRLNFDDRYNSVATTPDLPGMTIVEYDHRLSFAPGPARDLSILRLRTDSGYHITVRNSSGVPIPLEHLSETFFFNSLQEIEQSKD